MGLLEKATKFAGLAESGDPAETGGTSAPFGLRARAEMLFQRTASSAQQSESPSLSSASSKSSTASGGGISIHGLRARAEAMREAIPPLPGGLLARAMRMRSAAAPTPEPTAAPLALASGPVAPVARALRVPEEPKSAEVPETFAVSERDGIEFSEPDFSDAVDSSNLADVPDADGFEDIGLELGSDSEDDPVLAFEESPPDLVADIESPQAAPGMPEVESLAPVEDEVAEGMALATARIDESTSVPEEEALVFDPSELSPTGPEITEPLAAPRPEAGPDGMAAEPRGLLERADQMRAEGAELEPEAAAGIEGPTAAEVEPADPRLDDLLPEDHVPVEAPLAHPDSAEATDVDLTAAAPETTTDAAGEAQTAQTAQTSLPELDDPDQDTAHLVHDELRDFDAFLDREIIPDDLPEAAPVPPQSVESDAADASSSAGRQAEGLFAEEEYDESDARTESPAAPDSLTDPADLEPRVDADGLPQLPYTPPAIEADPARDPGSEPNLDADPFGLWEQDAEREAEEHARQLELRGEVPGVSESEQPENLLFEVDEGFTTAPVEAHIASQKKIDHYLSLFDITKEISNISEFEELWENILYAIMGQVGAETICILSSTQRVSSGAIFYPVAHSGFELPEGWALKRGDAIYDQTAAASGVRYADEFLNSLQNPISPLERRILENTKAQIVVPLKNMGQMFGIVILGGQVSGDDYTIDDLEFLTLLGEIAAVGVDRVLSRIEFERDTEELRRRNMVHGSMFSLARRASGVGSLDEMYDILTRHLREDFSAQSFSLVLLSPRDRKYRIFAGNEISPASIERFSLGVNSELVATISNLVRVYDLKDFRENREIASCYTNDDIGLMQHYWIVPLINMNWLVGFITVHRTSVSWTEFHRELMVTAAEIVSPVFANCIIMGERESLFRDPFSPLETRLTQELERADQFRSPLSLVDIRVKNIRRLLELNPGEEVTAFLMALNRTIASALFETDFMARVGQGRFALILPGRARAEAEIFVKKLTSEFKRLRLLPASPVEVQYAHQIISAPADADQAGKMLSIFE